MNVAVSPTGLAHLQQHPDDWATLVEIATDFRVFLNHWRFLDRRTGKIRILGHELWAAQEEFVKRTQDQIAIDKETGRDWIFFLKARKLGETTIECAYDAWVMRFRDVNARVHLFSRRDDAAQGLLKDVRYGLVRMPDWTRLPASRETTHVYELDAGEDDKRVAQAYPADNETAVEETCTHGHVDEWARMGNPQKVWQAIEPTMAGSCHIVTTGLGPTNYSSEYWRRCLTGDARHNACFIGALNRPDRDAVWLRAKRRGMDEQAFLQEYPMRWEDALSGGGEFVFKPKEIDAAGTDFRGMSLGKPGRKYVLGFDTGRHQDAAVLITLDVTEPIHDVVDYRRMREVSYPYMQAQIKEAWLRYPNALVAIEKNAAGEAVLENLDIPEQFLEGWTTTRPSKAKIISGLKVCLQNHLLKWDPIECSQLDAEMRGYQEPDDHVVQDSVMALAIAEEHAHLAHKVGTVKRIGIW